LKGLLHLPDLVEISERMLEEVQQALASASCSALIDHIVERLPILLAKDREVV
jgi:hypothetical protein